MRNDRALVVCVCGAAILAASFGIYYRCVGFVCNESLQFTYALPRGQVKDVASMEDRLSTQEKINRRQATIRALSDCFGDWVFDSHARSRPFYKKVVERVVERRGVVDMGVLREKISRILKDVQFEVVKGPDDALPVTARIVLRAKDALLLKETATAYKECVMEYVKDENKKREERAVSPLRGKYIALQAEVDRLGKGVADRDLSDSEKAVLRDKKANLEETLLSLEAQIKEATNIAHEYRCEISFLPSK